MNLGAYLCIDSILNMSFSVYGAQTTQAYSKIGFKNPLTLLALLVTFLTYWDHNLESMTTPRYLVCVTSCITSLFSKY